MIDDEWFERREATRFEDEEGRLWKVRCRATFLLSTSGGSQLT